jgi:hypothetical protein
MNTFNIQKTPENKPAKQPKYHETTVSMLGQKIIVSVAAYSFLQGVRKNLFAADNAIEKLTAARFILEELPMVCQMKEIDLAKKIIVEISKISMWLSQSKLDEGTQLIMAKAVAEEVYTDFKFLTFEDLALAIKLGAKGKFKDKGDVLYLSPQMIYSWIQTYNEKIKVPAAKLVVEAKEKINYQKATEVIQNKGESQKGILESILKIAKIYQEKGSYEPPNLPIPEAVTSLEALYYQTIETLKIGCVSPNDKWVFLINNIRKGIAEIKNNPILRMQKEPKEFIVLAENFLADTTQKELLNFNNTLFALAKTRSQADCFKLLIQHSKEIDLVTNLEKHINAWKQS